MKDKKTGKKFNNKINTKDIAIFGMLGGVMYVSKLLMSFLPNIHLIGTFIVAMTVVYGFRALYPLYVFIFLEGLFNGFGTWWIPYLYIWLPLWGATMLLRTKTTPRAVNLANIQPTPRAGNPANNHNIFKKYEIPIYCILNGLHGLLFGTLYAPFQAICFGLGFKGMLAWIVAGLPWDLMHACGNIVCGLLIVPLIKLLRMCERLGTSMNE